MTTPARPSRSRASWFADLPIAGKILSLVLFSASIGLVLCVVAVGRIGALDESQRDMYEGHVIALSDLDAIQATYEGMRQGYTAYFLADPATRTALEGRLAAGRATLDAQLEAYAGITEHPDLFSTLRGDVGDFLEVSDGQFMAAMQTGDVATAGAVAAGPLVQVQDAVTTGLADLRTVLREEADVQAQEGADEAAYHRLLELGAAEHEKPIERGPGYVTASVVDPFGNVLGVMFNQHYLDVIAERGR